MSIIKAVFEVAYCQNQLSTRVPENCEVDGGDARLAAISDAEAASLVHVGPSYHE
jgi:hypothetical protein